jgi:glycosyltransferase involved in cell wall biosynthesis
MLTQFYLPVIGGEERIIHDMSVELVKRGHEVVAVTTLLPGLPECEVVDGVKVYRIQSMIQRFGFLLKEKERPHAPPFPDPGFVAGLRKIIQREKPDVVHAHNWMGYSFLPLKVFAKIPFIATIHDYSFLCAQGRLIYQNRPCSGPGLLKCMDCCFHHYGGLKGPGIAAAHWGMRQIEGKLVDLFLPPSQSVAVGNRLDQYGNYQVLPNFLPDQLDESEPGESAHMSNLPQGDYLLFVGDLSYDKGIHILLDAYQRLKNAPPLVLIGRRLQETPAVLPPNVYYMGKWPHPAVMEAWRRCLFAIVPSVWQEAFGLVALEAMAVGKPVIASRAGGLSEFIEDGKTGILVPPGDAQALADAIEWLSGDKTLIEQMGQASAQEALSFRASAIVPEIIRIYESVTKNAYERRKRKSNGREKLEFIL